MNWVLIVVIILIIWWCFGKKEMFDNFSHKKNMKEAGKLYGIVQPLLSQGQFTYENFKSATGITDNPPLFANIKSLYHQNLLTQSNIAVAH